MFHCTNTAFVLSLPSVHMCTNDKKLRIILLIKCIGILYKPFFMYLAYYQIIVLLNCGAECFNEATIVSFPSD